LDGLKHLLSPIKIRNMELANRVVMPPMGTSLGNDDATVSEALLAYISRNNSRASQWLGRPKSFGGLR